MTKTMPVPKRTLILTVLLLVLLPVSAFILYQVGENNKKTQAELSVKMTASTKELRQAGKFKEALEAAQQWTQVQPDNALAWHEQGLAAEGLHELSSAQAAMEKAIQIDHHDGQFVLDLAGIFLQQGEFRLAEGSYQNAVHIMPKDGHAMLGLARSFIAQGKNLSEAENLTRRALQTISGESITYFTLAESLSGQGKNSEAKAAAMRGLALEPANAGGYALLTRIYHEMGDTAGEKKARAQSQAIRQFTSDSAQVPDPIRLARGEDLLEAGQNKEALAEFIAAAKHDITNAGALEGAGLALLQLGDKSSAIAYLSEAIHNDPDRVRAGIALGITAYENGQYENAMRYLKRVTATQPLNAIAWHGLGMAYTARQLHDTEAEDALRHAVLLDEKNPSFLMDLADTLKTNNKMTEAETVYRRALALAREDPETNSRFGAFLAVLPPEPRRRTEAQALLEKSLKAMPDYSFAQYHLGRLLVEEEKYAEGTPLLEKATAGGNGKTKDAWSVLARAYRHLRQTDKAVAALAKADKIQQENDRYDRAVERLSSNLNDPAARLEVARASALHNQTARAISEYMSYLRHIPNDSAVQKEYAAYVAALKKAGKYPDMALYNRLNIAAKGP